MTADEIRDALQKVNRAGLKAEGETMIIVFLQEIAAQLAELNAHLRSGNVNIKDRSFDDHRPEGVK
jgi:hypothetical protein